MTNLTSISGNEYIDMSEHNIKVLHDMSTQFPMLEWKFNKFYPNPRAVSVGHDFIVRFKHDLLGFIRCEVFHTNTEFRPTMTINEMVETFNNMTYRPSNLALRLQGIDDLGAFLENSPIYVTCEYCNNQAEIQINAEEDGIVWVCLNHTRD